VCAGCYKVDFNDLVSSTSLVGINIKILGFVIRSGLKMYIYSLGLQTLTF
jgi:hypothetical protein